MTQHTSSQIEKTLVRLVALAGRLEREGQYNVAKLTRAAADAVARQAAYTIDLPPDKYILAQHTLDAAEALAGMAIGDESDELPTTGAIFAEYLAGREKLLARLEAIPLRDWWRTGQHEEFGMVTIRQQVSYFAAHESTHMHQIQALASGQPA